MSINKDSQKAPNLRFKGFTDDWEQRKLKEVSVYSNGGSYENDVKESGKYELITLKSVDMTGNLVSSGKFIDKEEVPTLKEGTLIMVLSEQSPGLLGMTAEIPESNKYVLNQRVAGIVPTGKNDGYFLSMAININQRYFSKRGAGTKVQNISKGNVENFEFFCPTSNEQRIIGTFFKNFNETITLHQRKLDQLNQLKEALLQQMFPGKGETVPKLRFAGFAGDWEERTLGDYLKIPNKTKVNVQSKDELMTLKLNLGGLEAGSNRDTLALGSTVYYKRKAGQFIYGKQNFFNGSMAIIPLELDGKATSGDVPSLDIVGISTEYLFTYVSRDIYWKTKEAKASGTGSKRIHEKNLQEFEILVPREKEQQKIGSFFKHLDNTITLQQRKLDQLKNTKQILLQNMFI